MSYKFHEPPARPTFGPLPPGDYAFTVASCDEPYEKNGKWILPIKLTIQPDGTPVFANPWSGRTSAGEDRDDIASFLVCVNRAPKPGQEPDWDSVVGARGRCRLKVEIAQMGALAGKEVNRVAFFFAPKQVGSTTEQKPRSYSPEEVKKSQDKIAKNTGGAAQGDLEPDDIPF